MLRITRTLIKQSIYKLKVFHRDNEQFLLNRTGDIICFSVLPWRDASRVRDNNTFNFSRRAEKTEDERQNFPSQKQ